MEVKRKTKLADRKAVGRVNATCVPGHPTARVSCSRMVLWSEQQVNAKSSNRAKGEVQKAHEEARSEHWRLETSESPRNRWKRGCADEGSCSDFSGEAATVLWAGGSGCADGPTEATGEIGCVLSAMWWMYWVRIHVDAFKKLGFE